MTKKQYNEYKQRKEIKLKIQFLKNIMINLEIIVFIIIIHTMWLNSNAKTAIYDDTEANESVKDDEYTFCNDHITSGISAEISESLPNNIKGNEANAAEQMQTCQKFEWNEHEEYLLARIVMAEAEDCDYSTKQYVIMCILNRVLSDEFPNTIEEVIFEPKQFSPITNGRWDRVEPNEECYNVVKSLYNIQYDILYQLSEGCLYFESCKGESWHSKNLNLLFTADEMKFYK